jgi:hypothetical protein
MTERRIDEIRIENRHRRQLGDIDGLPADIRDGSLFDLIHDKPEEIAKGDRCSCQCAQGASNSALSRRGDRLNAQAEETSRVSVPDPRIARNWLNRARCAGGIMVCLFA